MVPSYSAVSCHSGRTVFCVTLNFSLWTQWEFPVKSQPSREQSNIYHIICGLNDLWGNLLTLSGFLLGSICDKINSNLFRSLMENCTPYCYCFLSVTFKCGAWYWLIASLFFLPGAFSRSHHRCHYLCFFNFCDAELTVSDLTPS